MEPFVTPPDTFPEYHQNLIIVGTQPDGDSPMTFEAVASNALPETPPGLGALRYLERAGMIRRVVPLAREVSSRRISMAAAGGVASLFSDHDESVEDPNAGVSILELERDEEVDEIRMMLARDPGCRFASRVPVRYAHAGIAAVPPPADSMWNLARIRWREARNLPGFTEATDIRVAVLDTGIDPAQPDLQGRIVKYEYSVGGVAAVSTDKDIIGHGTHVAGTICANIGNNLGINGICACQLYIWKIFDDTPDFFRGTFQYFVNPFMYRRALAGCIQDGVDVVNLSIGGPASPDPQESMLFSRLVNNGVGHCRGHGKRLPTGKPNILPGRDSRSYRRGRHQYQRCQGRLLQYGTTHRTLCARRRNLVHPAGLSRAVRLFRNL